MARRCISSEKELASIGHLICGVDFLLFAAPRAPLFACLTQLDTEHAKLPCFVRDWLRSPTLKQWLGVMPPVTLRTRLHVACLAGSGSGFAQNVSSAASDGFGIFPRVARVRFQSIGTLVHFAWILGL